MTTMKNFIPYLIIPVFLFSCSPNSSENSSSEFQEEVQSYLNEYNAVFQKLSYQSSKAHWASNTKIVEGDTTNAYNVKVADEALAKFSGSQENIDKARKYLENKDKLDQVQVLTLEKILYNAANNPEIVTDLVSDRIEAEALQTEKLFGFEFTVDGNKVSPNEIDEILRKETDVSKRLTVWAASKEVGKGLKPGLVKLRELRNGTVQALGYADYFSYQVSEYGMTTEEMIQACNQMIRDVWPLYRGLHTWARYNLAEKYGEEVPEYLPAHWLPNRWGQDWSALVEVEGIDLDGVLEEKGAEWLVRQSERFYVSLGFEALPPSFYELSSLYPLPDSVDYKKNNHASAWHLDLENDVRSLMSVIPNSEWYETTHHELGHVYYFMEYTNPDIPPVLRSGANRAFHEAIGSMMGLAAMQKPFLANLELIPSGLETDEIQTLLKEALNYIVFIPWSAGVMTHFEHQLYSMNLSENEYNKTWWDIKKMYQGIVPPTDRGEQYCDAASKTHINNDAAQYYDYALSFVLLFQIHDHIAENILNQNPRSTNYYGNKEIGIFLHEILSPGATVDWRELLKEKTGSALNAKPMLDYFQPLIDYLNEQNAGRVHTLSESI